MIEQESNPSWQVVEGDPQSTVILHVPHSSQTIPVDIRSGIVLNDVELQFELLKMTDSHTSTLANSAHSESATKPWMFINLLSRLVVDPERFPDDREEMAQVGMGAVYTQTHAGQRLREMSTEQRGHLVTKYFDPYAKALTELVQQRLETNGHVTIVDVHSYPANPLPYELHGDGPRPAICLGTDSFHTSPSLITKAQIAFQDMGGIGLDSPFAGTYVPMTHYGIEPKVQSIMIEIRRDLYMDEVTGQFEYQKAGPLTSSLTAFIASI
jgi:N-formylglutamate deformylase